MSLSSHAKLYSTIGQLNCPLCQALEDSMPSQKKSLLKFNWRLSQYDRVCYTFTECRLSSCAKLQGTLASLLSLARENQLMLGKKVFRVRESGLYKCSILICICSIQCQAWHVRAKLSYYIRVSSRLLTLVKWVLNYHVYLRKHQGQGAQVYSIVTLLLRLDSMSVTKYSNGLIGAWYLERASIPILYSRKLNMLVGEQDIQR